MANRKTNIFAGIFMLLHLASFIAFNAWGQLELQQDSKIAFIVYLAAVALLAIVFFAKCYEGAQLLSIVAGIALITIGVKTLLKAVDNKVFEVKEMEYKLAVISLIAFAMLSGLAYFTMCISLGINRKRLSSTGFAVLPILFALLGGCPWVIENIRAYTSDTVSYKMFGVCIKGSSTYLTFIIFLAVFALTFILAIILGSCCYKFKGRKVSNYVPMDNFDINVTDEERKAEAAAGGFYTPFTGRETQTTQTFYEPKYDEPAEKKVDATAFSHNNIYENETHFTATKEDYVEHEFNVSAPNATEVIKHETVQPTPVAPTPVAPTPVAPTYTAAATEETAARPNIIIQDGNSSFLDN